MINRQDCYNALFKLKATGVDVSTQLEIMQRNKGVPYGVIQFLQENSPQFQFYRYIQKRQRKLSESLLDYETLSDTDKIIACSSLITRVMIAVKCKELDESLLDELNISDVSDALNRALSVNDFTRVNEVLKKHSDSLRLFYKSNRSDLNETKS